MAFTGFGTDAQLFFVELGHNNERAWWLANKDRYDASIGRPLRALADDLSEEFGPVHVFRPNRDVRFSNDKRPYKEHAAFSADASSTMSNHGAVYFHLSPDGVFLGGGLWRPASAQLAAIRATLDNPGAASELHDILDELEADGILLGDGDPVATAPRGWSVDHPEIDLLRRRSLTVSQEMSDTPWLHTPDAVDFVARRWRAMMPFVTWLDAAASS